MADSLPRWILVDAWGEIGDGCAAEAGGREDPVKDGV